MIEDPSFSIVSFNDISPVQWDGWVEQIPEATYLHSASFLTFLHAMVGAHNVRTFACVQGGTPLALCPLGIASVSIGGRQAVEASWNGAPLGMPAFAAMAPSVRAKVQSGVYSALHETARSSGAVRCFLRRHPVSIGRMRDAASCDRWMFAALKEQYQSLPQNTLLVDLALSADELLSQMSKYHRRHIKRSERDGLRIVEYGAGSSDIDGMFAQYQRAHAKSAGKQTRSQESFDLMAAYIHEDKARLFVAFAKDMPISYLYCGQFHSFSFGWSQVNLDEYEEEFSPRHLLEWHAMLAYKRLGYRWYEVGTLYFGPQPYKIPSDKECSIAEFKRRFGGAWYPELYFERFFDRQTWISVQSSRSEAFLGSGYFTSP